MPNRPRPHQLEDRSINRFEALLPDPWVVRRKGHDYGIDLEIKIFEDDGRATGLIFLAQIRATDDIKKRQKLQLSFEQLEYFLSLDLPTLIVRYCDADASFHGQWHNNIACVVDRSEGQQSFTKTFVEAEAWSETTPNAVRKTLETLRVLEAYPPNKPISINSDASALAVNERYAVERAIDEAIDLLPGLISRDRRAGDLTLDITATPRFLKTSVDCISSLSIAIEEYEREKVLTSLLYCVAALLKHHRLGNQAAQVALAILARGERHHSKFVAFEAARALSSDLNSSVKLALLNGLHEQHDESYGLYTAFLLTTGPAGVERSEAVESFYDAALNHAATVSPQTEAAVHYSLANLLRSDGTYGRAVQHYNRARKLRPEYEEASYFLGELGACFFGTTHYRCAAAAYEKEQFIAPNPRGALHLGDALLFSGSIADAEAEFQKAQETDDDFLKSEAVLKELLCSWLRAWGHDPRAPVLRDAANRVLAENEGEPDLWARIIQEVDAVNEVAQFNLGVHWFKIGSIDKALAGFLLCAFKQSGDYEAWANAMICAHRSGDAELLVGVMSTALALAGRRAYDKLRDLLVEQAAPEGLLAGLDEVAHELNTRVQASRSRDVTLRALSERHYDVAQVVL